MYDLLFYVFERQNERGRDRNTHTHTENFTSTGWVTTQIREHPGQGQEPVTSFIQGSQVGNGDSSTWAIMYYLTCAVVGNLIEMEAGLDSRYTNTGSGYPKEWVNLLNRILTPGREFNINFSWLFSRNGERHLPKREQVRKSEEEAVEDDIRETRWKNIRCLSFFSYTWGLKLTTMQQ